MLLSPASVLAQWRSSTPQEQALDAAAFQGVASAIGEEFPDVQSAAVALRGRLVFQYHRDGNPEVLRNVQSVAKSAVSALVGIAIKQGRIATLDERVTALVPEWDALNPDPRARDITLRHLLTMTAGFQVNDPTGTASPGRAGDAWARPMASAPGQSFAYDNAAQALVLEVLQKTVGTGFADYAHEQLVKPLGMKEPSYQRGLSLRTEDMAKLGQLFLQNGVWEGRQLLPSSFAADATAAQNAGGAPVGLSYGYGWWVVPSKAQRQTFLASGYSGQFIWVFPGLELVVAATSTVSPAVQGRGQALQLMRTRIYDAAQARSTASDR
ncbi:serine hydrolase domain-containing protein [Variovorax sp. RA8]|uniref:serine hydrolase domain-containing protein n=1 Tax=Variovorax sp. (strain JCM 16519 / RA8) TaxID=662548 RepID=UPI000AF50E55|nr:serine hydrolase [Variovorax sp. RA8]